MAMAMAMMVNDAGGSLTRLHDDFKATFGESIADSTEYKGIEDAVDRVDQALQTAKALDEQKSNGFWKEVGEFFQHGGVAGYLADRARFEAQKKELIAAADANLRNLREAAKPAIEFIPVPDRLMTQKDRWQTVLQSTRRVAEQVPSLQDVEGWTGDGADQYRRMAEVQAGATTDLQVLAERYGEMLDKVRTLNLSVLSTYYTEIEAAATQSSVCVAAGPNEFYANTANCNRAMIVCLEKLIAASEMVGQQCGVVESDIQRVHQSSLLYTDDWPVSTGTAERGSNQPTAPTVVDDMPDDVEVDTRVEGEGGVQR